MPEPSAIDRTRPRRARGRRRRVLRLVLGGSMALAVAGHRADAGAAVPPPFAIDLDQTSAVFQLTDLRPGPIGSRCLVLTVSNGSADQALLSATVGGTGLADYLDLTVEAGDSADPAVCTDFTGAVAFAGTVAALGALHPDAASGVPLPLLAQQRAVVRFTLSLRNDNDAMGRTATLAFRFDAQDVSSPPPTTVPPTTVPPSTVPASAVPPTGGPVPTEAPAGPPATGPTAPDTTAVASSTTSASSTTTSTAAATTTTSRARTAATRAPRAGADAGDGTSGTDASGAPQPNGAPRIEVTDPTAEPAPVDMVTRAVEALTETATVAAKTSTVPAAFLSFVAFFLLVQDRFDRNDPKLARAPLAPEPEMVFQPRRGRVLS